MKTELDVRLCQRYPLIFAERASSKQTSGTGRAITCGDGWFDLIDALCERLQFWTDQHQAPQVVAVQVKEKWGALCFYPSLGASQEQLGMIHMAEAMSARICAQCGKPGQTLVHADWFMTRCAQHAPAGASSAEAFLAQGKVPGWAP